MRVSTLILFLLVTIMVIAPGCKLGRKNGVHTASRNVFKRAPRNRSVTNLQSSLASRGTAECDCYTCRMKRQQTTEEYVIDPPYDQMNFTPAVESTEQSSTLSPVIGTIVEPPRYDMPDSATPLNSQPIEIPVQKEIQGEVISDDDLTNELPSEPEVRPILISPEASYQLDRDPSEFIPVIESNAIPTKQVKTTIKESVPTVDEPVFELKTLNDSVFENRHEIEALKSRRESSIWFTPLQKPNEPAQTVPIKVEPVVKPQPRRKIQPQEPSELFLPPVIEHEAHKIKQPEVTQPIVLHARPVDRHLIYNSRRPIHAPVREARLTDHSEYATSHRQPVPDRTYFHPLPPAAEQTLMSPAPAPLPSVGPQQGSQFIQPLPKQQDDAAELRLQANPTSAGLQTPGSQPLTPMARVIQTDGPVLRLNAAPTDGARQTMPPIVSIQRQSQDRVIVGSIQTSESDLQSDSVNNSSGTHRLLTTPWQPMQTGADEFGQVQQSIRQLMIQPQQEANFATDGIHR